MSPGRPRSALLELSWLLLACVSSLACKYETMQRSIMCLVLGTEMGAGSWGCPVEVSLRTGTKSLIIRQAEQRNVRKPAGNLTLESQVMQVRISSWTLGPAPFQVGESP